MSRPARALTTLALGVAAAATLAACGGGGAQLLPGETAREITANLESVRRLADEGDCVGAEDAARQVGEQVEALHNVDRRLKAALDEAATRLEAVVAGCEEKATEAIAPETEPLEEEATEKAPPGKKKHKAEPKQPKLEPGEEAPPEGGEGSLPPQANGEAKGHEEGGGGPPAEEEAESGGIAPGEPVEGAE